MDAIPPWLLALVGPLADRGLVARDGVLRAAEAASAAQAQTADAFGYKWQRTETFDSDDSRARARAWLVERYGDIEAAPWWGDLGTDPLVVDVGCGAALSAVELFGERLHDVRYLGVDLSEAVDVAGVRLRDRGIEPGLLQADFTQLPLPDGCASVVLAEGVLHHTDSTAAAWAAVSRLLEPGGRLLAYVYATKGPVREFTDDLIRAEIQDMAPEDAWAAMEPLTKLGILLGELDAEIEIEDPIDLLGIPAGRTSVQRLVYWNIVKAFHHPDLTFEEMNHINFDWFAPRNAHRQTPEEVRSWCAAAGLEIEREVVEPAGITVVARRATS